MSYDYTVCLIYCSSAFEISCFIEKFCLAFFRGGEGIKKMIKFLNSVYERRHPSSGK